MKDSPFWQRLLERKLKHALGEYRFFIVAYYTFTLAAALHFLLIIFFFFTGVYVMAYVNIVSVAIFLFCIYLVQKHSNYLVSGLLASMEVVGHAALAVHFIGWESGFQYYILVLSLTSFIFPVRKQVSILVLLFSAISFTALLLIYSGSTPPLSLSASTVNFIHTIVVLSTMSIISMIGYYFKYAVDTTEGLLQVQAQQIQKLLHNILPISIADRLKSSNTIIADDFPEVSILFADIEGFTQFANSKPPDELVSILNNYFSLFDDLLDHYGMEKIKTIGDAYMAVCGCPDKCPDHAEKTVDFALAILAATRKFNDQYSLDFSLRIGINSGPIVAGIIGKRKYYYDMWGDTVNIASRMEARGAPQKIHITDNTYKIIKHKYSVAKCEPLILNGIGSLQTYYVTEKLSC